MHIIGKPTFSHNGYPWVGVVTLITDSKIIPTKSGRKIWNAYAKHEAPPKNASQEERSKGNINITTGYNMDLADQLTTFPKGTLLLVCGHMEKDMYRTKKYGKEVWQLVAEYILAQPDYSNLYGGSASEYEAGTSEDSYENTDCDPGF